jgi:hypothetical protein
MGPLSGSGNSTDPADATEVEASDKLLSVDAAEATGFSGSELAIAGWVKNKAAAKNVDVFSRRIIPHVRFSGLLGEAAAPRAVPVKAKELGGDGPKLWRRGVI